MRTMTWPSWSRGPRATICSRTCAGRWTPRVAEGTTLETFRKRFDGIVGKHGWSYKGGRDWRTEDDLRDEPPHLVRGGAATGR